MSYPDSGMYDNWQDWADAFTAEVERMDALRKAEPTGKLAIFRGTAVGAGYLECNGGSFSATSYPSLAAYLGGTTLPNYTSPLAVSVVGIKT